MREPFVGICSEKNQTIIRVATAVEKWSDQKLDLVYQKIKDIPNFIGKSDIDLEALDYLLQPNVVSYLVDSVGIVVFRLDEELRFADVHITFWDKRLRGRERFCRRLGEHVMKTEELEYLFTFIPMSARAILCFAKRVGFETVKTESDTQVLRFARDNKTGSRQWESRQSLL